MNENATIVDDTLKLIKPKKVIHVLVALCDNENQGIVPVSKMLGNGLDPGNNLYWGAMYGVKSYLEKKSDWKLIKTLKNPTINILERCVFKHKRLSILLVADAYKGSEIKQATKDLFLSLSGQKIFTLKSNSYEMNLYAKAELLVYIGHNGLMDFKLSGQTFKKNKKINDVIVLACKSKQYFKQTLSAYKSNIVLLTTGFMAPEAYTLNAALEGWVLNETKNQIKIRAAKAYHKYQKCGMKGALRLFYTE
ncbi:MAG: hypothetical protein COA79_01110 [Planctomycetota bacterium]|nr:MAG: hypothetical protein COA79_01110 [Planctomycetota bacterium]